MASPSHSRTRGRVKTWRTATGLPNRPLRAECPTATWAGPQNADRRRPAGLKPVARCGIMAACDPRPLPPSGSFAIADPYQPPSKPRVRSEGDSVGPPAEQWGSRIGVILAVAGSAVGLGNFLRFPGQVAANGGGAFMLPYFISLLVLGIPLCWAEWTMGRFAGLRGLHSAPGIFAVVCGTAKARYAGALGLLVPLVIYMYYIVVEAWCLTYAIGYATGDLMLGEETAAYEDYFNTMAGTAADGSIFSSSGTMLLAMVAITFAVNFTLIYRGVANGIETFCKFAIPAMVVCALCVLLRVLTLPAEDLLPGLGFMWNPQPEALWQSKTWMAASGQIFFSLSVGFGVIINYASYMKKDDDVVLSGLTACSMNEFFEVCLGGLITLPAAFIFFGMSAADFGTFSLGFNALPNVFAQMPAGRLFGFLWFFLLFLAAVTSSLSMLQPVIAFLEEGFGLRRRASAGLLGGIALIGASFVVYYSAGLVALDTFDFWIGTFGIYVLAMFQAVIYGWVFGIRRGEREAHLGANLRIPRLVQYLLKYVVPVYLLVIFSAFCWQELRDGVDDDGEFKAGSITKVIESPAALASVMFILAVLAMLLVAIHFAGRRWIRQGLFDLPEPETTR